VALAVVAVLLCLYAFAGGQASGPGEGEVSVILNGGFMMLALVGAGFFALVAALFAFWHVVWARRALLMCTVGPVVLAAGTFALGEFQHKQRDKAYKQQQAEEQARRDEIYRQVVPISNRYLRHLTQDGFDPSTIHDLRAEFFAEMRQSGIEDWQRSSPKHYFDMVTDLYSMTLGTPDDAPVPDPILGGLLYDPVCYNFYRSFSTQFSARQAETFGQYCPEWLIKREKELLEAASEGQ